MESLELVRIEPKHYRWFQEIVQGGSLLLYRPGAGQLHKAPDGLSRNPEGRDRLILAKNAEWSGFRERIRGCVAAIVSGEADDEDAEAEGQDVGLQHLVADLTPPDDVML